VKTGNIQAAGAPQSAAAAPSDSELHSQIQQALDKEPTLAGRTVSVAVSGRSIDLSGSVANPRQKLTATRIVESYAANRKVVNHLTIGTAGGNTAGTSTGEKENDATSPGRTDLSSHPEPEKGSPPGSSSRPPQ
jgi:osmotically-inducible protein OsmY